MIRQGTCNQCGQCCGAGGTDPCSPFPKNWPDAIRNWNFADFGNIFHFAPLLGIEEGPSGEVVIASRYGNINFTGYKVNWRWVPGHGLCKNLPDYDDPDTWSPECPFLLPDPGDGTRPCVFVGSRHEDLWATMCGLQPLETTTQEDADEWLHWYPDCSYTWSDE